MEFREIKEKDINSVWKLIKRNFNEIMIEDHSETIIEKFKVHNTPEKLKEQMDWKDIFVIEENKKIIGTGAIANFGDDNSPMYCISNFFIKPELHNHGIGKELLNYLLKIAKEKDIKKLHVPSSRTALGFYKKMGFKIKEDQPDKEDEITWMSMDL